MLYETVEEMVSRGLAFVIDVPPSAGGRKGMVVFGAAHGLSMTATFGELAPDDFWDIFDGSAQEYDDEVPLGNSGAMTVTLKKIQTRFLEGEIDKALQQPVFAHGVTINDQGVLVRTDCAAGQPKDVPSLHQLVHRDIHDPILEQVLGKKVSSRKFRQTHVGWRCIGGTLIMPTTSVTEAMRTHPNLADKIFQWNPLLSPWATIWAPPRVDEGERQPCSQGQISGERGKILGFESTFLAKRDAEEMKDTETRFLEISKATSSCAFSGCVASNVLRADDAPWEVTFDPTGQYTLVLTLAAPAEVLGVGLYHSNERRVFTKVQVHLKGIRDGHVLELPPGPSKHEVFLPNKIEGKIISLRFPPDAIQGDQGNPGLKHVTLYGRELKSEGQESATAEASGKKLRTAAR